MAIEPPLNGRPEPIPATGLRRLLYVVLGCFFVGMAWLGILLPGLPATPFLLLASYFFVRSSPRLHRWLHRSPVFGKLLHDWQTQRGIRRSVKITASCMVVIAVTLSISLTPLPVWAKCLIAGLAGVGLIVIWSIRTAVVAPAAPRKRWDWNAWLDDSWRWLPDARFMIADSRAIAISSPR
jgi:uncharacterized membrane protein YbaN (DUF454 family)